MSQHLRDLWIALKLPIHELRHPALRVGDSKHPGSLQKVLSGEQLPFPPLGEGDPRVARKQHHSEGTKEGCENR